MAASGQNRGNGESFNGLRASDSAIPPCVICGNLVCDRFQFAVLDLGVTSSQSLKCSVKITGHDSGIVSPREHSRQAKLIARVRLPRLERRWFCGSDQFLCAIRAELISFGDFTPAIG